MQGDRREFELSFATAILGLILSAAPDIPPDAVAEEFSAICLSQPAGFAGAITAARNRGWTEQEPGRPSSMMDGVLFGPGLPWRRLDYDRGQRLGSELSCAIVLHNPTCEQIHALAGRVGARIGRPPDSWDALNCQAIWRSAAGTRKVGVGHDGHALVRLVAFAPIQTERAQ